MSESKLLDAESDSLLKGSDLFMLIALIPALYGVNVLAIGGAEHVQAANASFLVAGILAAVSIYGRVKGTWKSLDASDAYLREQGH